MWNPTEHTDQENLLWTYLRAIEWGSWPIFISQPIGPLLLLLLPWQSVVVLVGLCNILWAEFVSYRYVSVKAAFWGAIFVRLKWLSCPTVAFCLYSWDHLTSALIAASWPLIAALMKLLKPVRVGKIQKIFMARLGYQHVGIA